MSGNQLRLYRDFSMHCGTLPDTHMHRHGAMIFVLSIGGQCQVELASSGRTCCRNALIDGGIKHRLLTAGEPVMAMYIESYHPLAMQLRRRYLPCAGVAFDPLTTPQSNAILSRQDPMSALLDHLSAIAGTGIISVTSSARSTGIEDTRIMRALTLADQGVTLSHSSRIVHLSESRLSHLFSQQLGISYQHYRLWRQAKRFLHALPSNGALTRYALDAGFSDGAHLSNTFRKLIGISPSEIVGSYASITRQH